MPVEPQTPRPNKSLQEAIYERVVIVIPYKAPDMVKRINQSFVDINLHLLGLDSPTYLNTRVLTPEEKQDRSMDFLGGFIFIEKECRIYVIEGRGGPGNSIDQFYKVNERQRPNDNRFKMLYNPDIKFKSRLYQQFNCSLKIIKIRGSLTQTVGEPDIYLRDKVPEEMYSVLMKFVEIRKLDRAFLLRDFDLYPDAGTLEVLERKYGDSINHVDLNGAAKRQKRRVKKTSGEMSTMSPSVRDQSSIEPSQFDGQSSIIQSQMDATTTKSIQAK